MLNDVYGWNYVKLQWKFNAEVSTRIMLRTLGFWEWEINNIWIIDERGDFQNLKSMVYIVFQHLSEKVHMHE